MIVPLACIAVASLGLPLAAQEGSPKPPPDVGAALARATALLIEKQETLEGAEGRPEWPYEGVYREGGEIPIGYRVGGTAICAWALLASPAYAESEPARQAVVRALEFVLEKLEDPAMAAGFRGGYDVRGWGHAYALHLLLELRAADAVPPERREEVEAWVPKLIDVLQRTEIAGLGGWNYSRPGGGSEPAAASPFMTAPTLLALFEAREQGFSVDAQVVERALARLEGSRNEAGAIPYSTGGGRDEWPGAIGRSPVTELSLWLAGRGDLARVRTALERFFEHWEWLEKRRKGQGTHVPPYGIAPYYFFYAHAYAALAIEVLPEAERPPLRARLLERLFQVREASGGWNDRVFPRSEAFGTAMSMIAMLAPSLSPSAGWRAAAGAAK